jgi:hypothetical protein
LKEEVRLAEGKDESAPVHEGGCLCGAIRYRAVGDPVSVTICHCINCQRNSGSAFSVNAVFPQGAVTMTGAPATYVDKGDTGANVVRIFCGTCGTPLESRSIMSSVAHVVIKVGTFDDPSGFVPGNEVYCRNALQWLPQHITSERHATMMPQFLKDPENIG